MDSLASRTATAGLSTSQLTAFSRVPNCQPHSASGEALDEQLEPGVICMEATRFLCEHRLLQFTRLATLPPFRSTAQGEVCSVLITQCIKTYTGTSFLIMQLICICSIRKPDSARVDESFVAHQYTGKEFEDPTPSCSSLEPVMASSIYVVSIARLNLPLNQIEAYSCMHSPPEVGKHSLGKHR